MSSCPCCLLALKPGVEGSICHFGNIDPLLKRRLIDLGIGEGSNVIVKQFCPMGGPILLEYCGQLLGIRKKEAAQIEVLVS